ncbi:hypothetical protein CGMCC3_g8085 [Colletotrichum fructicola]|nr:uncharacterized protein CGMCC3_g8085 [Colletotrichum fructicola]KAE9575983.1 hypothetical protein CGMCC3_g8085 [Colletotrichum fructicola]
MNDIQGRRGKTNVKPSRERLEKAKQQTAESSRSEVGGPPY